MALRDSTPFLPRSSDTNPNVKYAERKTSIYLKGDTLEQIRDLAARMDRSVSWVITRCFELSKDSLAQTAQHFDSTGE